MKEDVIFWLASMIVLACVEIATVNLVTIWFAVGALAALLAAAFGANLIVQIVLFVAVTAVTLCFTRPLAKKYLKGTRQATNADMVIGKICIVEEKIDNIAATGAVSCLGKQWSARTENDEVIDEGERVLVKSIRGVTLIVSPAENN